MKRTFILYGLLAANKISFRNTVQNDAKKSQTRRILIEVPLKKRWYLNLKYIFTKETTFLKLYCKFYFQANRLNLISPVRKKIL